MSDLQSAKDELRNYTWWQSKFKDDYEEWLDCHAQGLLVWRSLAPATMPKYLRRNFTGHITQYLLFIDSVHLAVEFDNKMKELMG